MNITRPWKRGLALGCSHGGLADPSALAAVLRFKQQWKPSLTIHLGDFVDMAAFRSGAKGSADEAESIEDDWRAGVNFLERLEPQQLHIGNHEDRVYRLQQSPNAIVSLAASHCVNAIHDTAKTLKASVVPYDIETGWRQYGDTKFGHGWMFNMAAIRDHAEYVGGNCVIAHLHRVGQERARTLGGGTGYCTGMLADKTRMAYAKHQKSKAGWSQGWVFFEYCPDETIVWTMQRTRSGEFRSPL